MGIVNYRKYARVEVDIPVNFILPGSEQPQEAYLNNLSEEGASLISSTALAVATPMEFDIFLPKITTPTHVRADILWSRPVNENGEDVFAHGIMFNRIEIEDRERLHSFIAGAMSY
ncbi:PilZ domain-containing protein [bacterium]|nr:PilZ domain-containing protein [bacterium]